MAEDHANDLGYATSVLVNTVAKGVEEELKPFDLAPIEYTVLYMCFGGKLGTVTALAQAMPVDGGRLSRVVRGLAKRKLIRKRRLRSDRRVVRLTLTEEGSALTRELIRRVQAHYEVLLEGIDDEGRRVFMAVIQQILANSRRGRES